MSARPGGTPGQLSRDTLKSHCGPGEHGGLTNHELDAMLGSSRGKQRSPRSIFILWWWSFNATPGTPQPLNFSEQSTRHTHVTHTHLCCSDTACACVSARKKPFSLTLEAERSRKRRATWMTRQSNFSCTHKSGVGEGERAAGTGRKSPQAHCVGARQLPFFGKSKQRRYKGQRPGQQQPSLLVTSLWETGATWEARQQ